jgi:hypothetical protein
MPKLVKIPNVWRSYESEDGEYSVMHHQNANIWRVSGGPPECYPIPADNVYFRTLAEAKVEVARRDGMRAA